MVRLDPERLGVVNALLEIINTHPADDQDAVLALFFLENYAHLGELNIFDVASSCYVSRASVRRFCQSIGFNSFKELKDGFRRYRHRYEYFLSLHQEADYIPKFTHELVGAIEEISERLDPYELDHIASNIHSAPKTVLLSSYSSAPTMLEFQRALILSGTVVNLMTELSYNESELLAMGSDDYVMAVSATGCFAEKLLPTLMNVKAKKALVTASRRADICGPFDSVYHLSAKDYSDRKSMHGKYGLAFMFDMIYDVYFKKYGTVLSRSEK